MTPLDDELRRTLHAQAGTLAPSPDPLAGIEQRARRIRRRRAAGAALSAAAAVAAVALVVPAFVNDRGPAPTRLASPSTTLSTSPSPAGPAPGELDPARPWEYRGDQAVLGDGFLDALRRDWAARHPGSTLTPLFGQVWEPSGLPEVGFVASDGTSMRVGWATASESGPDVLVDRAAVPDHAYQLALGGDEGVTRLYVLAAPTSRVLYAPDGRTFAAMTALAPGVGVTAVETPGARVRVVSGDGTVVYEADALGSASSDPANLLDWPARGDVRVGPSVHDLEVAFSRENGRTDGTAVHYRPLFTGDTDSGVRFTLGQAWFDGDSRATTVLYSVTGSDRGVLRQYASPDDPAVVAGLLTDLPGTSVDFLVVVPVPGTGQVSYDDDASGGFRPVTGQDHLDGVVLVDRARGEADDRLEVLDGDGDLDRPLHRGPVGDLLAPVR